MPLVNNEILELVELIPESEILIIKTHTNLNKTIDSLLRTGRIIASVTYRDPRDAAISLLDAGESDRKRNIERKFNEIWTIEQALDFYKNCQADTKQWLRHPKVLKVSYNLLALNPHQAAQRIRDYLHIEADIDPIITNLITNPDKKIWEYNVGKIGRYKDNMNQETIDRFLHEFRELIDLMNETDDRYQI
ncbi:MAG: sulfotransferase domain-containing protein [Candidatus Delongbacteria bacterium]|nr:sulfotransferase domain-containing protein [Candidatus Delongbacteria bacterium]